MQKVEEIRKNPSLRLHNNQQLQDDVLSIITIDSGNSSPSKKQM
jgi:hypothetical protein